MGKSLLVVGWDAATRAHLSGDLDLPFFDSLSAHDTLLPEPIWQNREVDSGTAWTTITTGLSMWDHRVATLTGMVEHPNVLRAFSKFDTLIPRNLFGVPARIWARKHILGKQPTNDDIRYKRVWHYLPNSLSFAVPLTYPPKPTDGVTVSGFPSPSVTVQPDQLEQAVQQRYDGEPSRTHDSNGGLDESYTEDLFSVHKQEVETVCWLDEQNEFQFYFVVFTLLDRLLHVVDRGDADIERAYKRLDTSTRTLIDQIDPDDVLILSDHGMRYAPRGKWRHIHDEKQGIWAGTTDFGLETHLDVTPAILDYYGVSMDDPTYDAETVVENTDEIEDRLSNLGYL